MLTRRTGFQIRTHATDLSSDPKQDPETGGEATLLVTRSHHVIFTLHVIVIIIIAFMTFWNGEIQKIYKPKALSTLLFIMILT
jgi:hypothetical protein